MQPLSQPQEREEMAATSTVLVGGPFSGPACFLPKKILKDSICSRIHQRSFAALVKGRPGHHVEVCRKHWINPVAVASSDVETAAAAAVEGDSPAPSTSNSTGPSVVKRFKSRQVWRKNPAKVTYLDSQSTRFAFIREVRYSANLDELFAKHPNLDLWELVHILYRLQERNEGRVAMKLVDWLEASPVYAPQLDEAFYRASLASISNYPYMAAKAAKLYKAAKEKDLIRKLETYNMYLTILAKKGDVATMEEVLKDIDEVRSLVLARLDFMESALVAMHRMAQVIFYFGGFCMVEKYLFNE